MYNLSKTTLVLIFVFVVIFLVAGFFLFRFLNKPQEIEENINISFNPDGPYALLLPRRDGNAINLNIKRVSSFEDITYELSYQSEGIDRGVQGKVTTQDKKNEYTQEILFGTCSKGDSFSTRHCVFDKNVENGTLVLSITQKSETKSFFKRTIINKIYKVITSWHLQRPDITLGEVVSADNHFKFKTDVVEQKLVAVGFTIINDLTGLPKLPEGKKVLGKVYTLNIPIAREMPSGSVSLEIIDPPPPSSKIGYYKEENNQWKLLDTAINNNILTAKADGAGIFAVLID